MQLFAYLATLLLAARDRLRDDRGDVPGWVMVTVMTAILVVAIIGIFEPQIKTALSGIIDSVSSSK
ncbi:MAG TPA: hypothetical protein VHS54_10380 [Jatrophihabitans sp.]|jgi:hypothetical protein|nr:hypothetical protein [Jatrophihabitans sp.]